MGGIFGGGPKPYKSKNTNLYEQGSMEGIFNRAGARRIAPSQASPGGQATSYTPGGPRPAAGTPAYTSWVNAQYGRKDDPRQGASQGAGGSPGGYDFSGVGQNLSGASGLAQAKDGYDFSPMDQAIAGFRNPQKFSQTYDPYKFNFESLPEEYARNEYELGAKDVRREGAGALQRIQGAMGTRRPGLLMKAAAGNQRNVAESLAGLNAKIRNEMLAQKSQLGKEQQLAQAGENFRGYQSRADLEGRNADEIFRYLNSLGQAGQNKIGVESGLMEQERGYQDAGLDRLYDLFKTGAGLQNNAAQNATERRGQTLGFLGSLFGSKK